MAAAFIQGAGAIEWLWNTNSYMTESNETPIGAVRTDGTEKPEATVMRQFAAFAASAGEHLRAPVLPAVAIVTSQAAQFSAMGGLQLEAQRKAVRALAYGARLMPYVVAENRLGELGAPALAILPSPQAMTEPGWQALIRYVKGGGTLLVTGPVDRDEHWHPTARATALGVDGRAEPLVFHDAALALGDAGGTVPLTFGQNAQGLLEWLRFADGSSVKEVPVGKGRIFWTACPIELAEGTRPAADVYASVAGRLGLRPGFELAGPVPPGILIWRTELDDASLYVLLSDQADAGQVDLTDRASGARLSVALPAQRAALALVSKRDGRVIARLGF